MSTMRSAFLATRRLFSPAIPKCKNRFLAVSFIFFLLSSLGVLYLTGILREDVPNPILTFEAASIVLLVLWMPVLLAAFRSRLEIFSPITLQSAGYTAFFVIPAVQAVQDPESDVWGVFALFPTVLSLLGIGYLFFIAGYYSNLGPSLANAMRSTFPFPFRDFTTRHSIWVILSAYATGWIARITLLGTNTYFHTAQGDFRYSSVGNLIGQIEWICKLVFIFFLVRYLKHPRSTYSRVLPLTTGLLEVVYNIPAGNRQQLVEIIVFSLVAYGLIRRTMPRWAIVTVVLCGLVAFPLLAQYRNIIKVDYALSGRMDISTVVQAAGKTIQSFSTGNIEVLQEGLTETIKRNSDVTSVAAIIRDTPAIFDYEYGKTYLGILFLPIP
ncbi:MAG: hypothetical protein M1305_06075, partial [Candidatus Marsarchaeota archaeon]|nr:hypothetical protein [Candidatus Marsarchaeota archaeon]